VKAPLIINRGVIGIISFFVSKVNRIEVQMNKKFILVVLSFMCFVAANAETIVTDSTTKSMVNSYSDSATTLKSPPPSAISPSINISNSDLCTVGVAGAVQTQILGLSAGTTVRDMNCERLKLSKTLYDMGMKVAAVSTLCQDKRVFDAMMMAGTPCPFDGTIGAEAKENWKTNKTLQPGKNEEKSEGMSDGTKTLLGGAGISALLLLLLL
jgi:hypothetical protein